MKGEYSSRFGVPAGTPVIALVVAFATIAFATWLGSAPDCPAKYIAAVPATCGLAIDVPSSAQVAAPYGQP